MRRRELIALLSAGVWLLATARAQQRMRRIGVLLFSADTDTEYQTRLRAFAKGLHELGWTDGRNVTIDVRWAGGSSQRMQEFASEFAYLAPDVVFCWGSVATAAMKRATSSVPVVFALVNEPVTQGFVASLARRAATLQASPTWILPWSERWWSCSTPWCRRSSASV